MPRKPARSQAEVWRLAREAFNLALLEGCTPAEACERIERREAKRKADAAIERLNAKINGTPIPSHTPCHSRESGSRQASEANPAQPKTPAPAANPELPNQPWMFRD